MLMRISVPSLKSVGLSILPLKVEQVKGNLHSDCSSYMPTNKYENFGKGVGPNTVEHF